MIKRAADRRHHVDALTFGLRRLGRDWRHISVRPLPAERLHLAFIENVGEQRLGIGDTPRLGDLARLFDSRLDLSLDLVPLYPTCVEPEKRVSDAVYLGAGRRFEITKTF